MYRQIPDTIKATWPHAGWAWTGHLEAPAVHVFTDLLEVVLGVVLLVVVLPRSLAGTTCADFVGWRAAASFSTLVNLEVSTTATMVHSCLNKTQTRYLKIPEDCLICVINQHSRITA